MTKKSNRFGVFVAMFATAVMCAHNAWAYTGKNKVTNDWIGVDLGMGGSTPACIWQPGFTVTTKSSGDIVWGSKASSTSAAYLLDGGVLTFSCNNYVQAPYLHFRQHNGESSMNWAGFRVTDGYHTEHSLRGDFVYSGDAVANNKTFGYFTMPYNISVSDNAIVNCGWSNENNNKWTNENIIAINGGRININTYDRKYTRCVYFYNGGELYTSYGGNSAAYGTNSYKAAVVRVCERGGSFCIASRTTELASFREPIGNVVKSVPLTDDVKAMVWPMPPAVVITGSGSNAFAVADWDFDTGHVTNITVLCCGEGYTEGTTKANFAYRKGDKLLTPALDCTLGTVQADGDFMFAMEAGSGDIAYFQARTTNEWRGATIVDMDRNHAITHDAALTESEYGHSLAIYGNAYFPYSTNIIIKSGELIDSEDTSLNPRFPSCNRLEAYSGHLARGSHSFKDVVIGGELWLCCIHKAHHYASVLNVTNTLWVAPGASVTNGVVVMPKIKYGRFTIGNDAKVAIQDWSKLPKGKKIVALDLSEVGTLNRKSGGPTLMPSDEGVLEWNDTEKKLYARRHADGMFLIFR